MAEAHELPLWYNNVWLGYIDTRKCRNKKAPFFYDINHSPIYVDDFCRQTGLRRTTWRQSISVEKPDGEIVPALPLITQPNQTATSVTERQVRRRPTASAPEPAPQARQTPVEYFSGLFSIARPPSQEAREAAREAAAAYLAEVDAREAARQEAAHAAATARDAEEARQAAARQARPEQDISAREMHLISLADIAENSSGAREDKICVICHEDLMSGRRLAATECGHVFCAGCISRSLRHKDVCPTCRKHQPNVTALFI